MKDSDCIALDSLIIGAALGQALVPAWPIRPIRAIRLIAPRPREAGGATVESTGNGAVRQATSGRWQAG
ncbi:hypothetical protein CS8_033360 [Cupriavidus sp. 8B]